MTAQDTSNTRTAVSTTREDVVTGLLAVVLVGGLYLDGWADHSLSGSPRIGIVFYGGFIAMVVWMFVITYRKVSVARPVRRSVPRGYRAGVIGVVVFVAGGIIDAWWHGAYGVEQGLAVLLSPTHLLLFSGLGLMVTSPFRASASRKEQAPEIFSEYLGALLSMAAVTSLLAFVIAFGMGLVPWRLEALYSPLDGSNELIVAYQVLTMIMTTLVLVMPVVVFLRRWDPPPGAVTFVYAIYAVLSSALTGFDQPWIMAAPIGAGLVADLIIRLTGAGPRDLESVHMVAAAIPLVVWSLFVALVARFASVGWDVGLWSGAILLMSAVGLTSSVVSTSRR
ncbi:MAG: hypothetical protein HKN07_08225 [Acidimicrobiia bacterium]|nr:hypothetical protein [Acidimicrobiia bacterium]NNF64235.1 hypothetical protein [Acidimicrobiia bacterium]